MVAGHAGGRDAVRKVGSSLWNGATIEESISRYELVAKTPKADSGPEIPGGVGRSARDKHGLSTSLTGTISEPPLTGTGPPEYPFAVNGIELTRLGHAIVRTLRYRQLDD